VKAPHPTSSAWWTPAREPRPEPDGVVDGTGAVRAAVPGDARAIATVHVDSWRVAYRGLLPDDYLAGLTPEQRTGLWTGILADPASGHVVVLEVGAAVVGFAHAGPSGDDDALPGTGELYTIYLHPDAWGRGFGRDLMEAVFGHLIDDGYQAVTLWMLSTNERARQFYLRQGWSEGTEVRTQEFGGQEVTDHRFVRLLTERDTPGDDADRQIFSRPSQ
jgi:GNAT superfamily N-acetyltransferase